MAIFSTKKWFKDNIHPYLGLIKQKMFRINTKIVDNKLVFTDPNGVETEHILPKLDGIALGDLTDVNVGSNDGDMIVYSEANSRWQNQPQPVIPDYSEQLNSDWKENNIDSKSYIKNKPGLSNVALSGKYNDLREKPNLSNVAISGDYLALSNKPYIPTTIESLTDYCTRGIIEDGHVITRLNGKWTNVPVGLSQQSDWTDTDINSSTYIVNKPALKKISCTGCYDDISGRPLLSNVATSGSYNDLVNKPSLSSVALSGSYYDLTNRPDIGSLNSLSDTDISSPSDGEVLAYCNNKWISATNDSTQVQSDWNCLDANSSAYIKNRPEIPKICTNGLSNGDYLVWNSSSIQFENISAPDNQVQADWTRTINTCKDYIKNKPEMRMMQFNDSMEWIVNHNTGHRVQISVYDNGGRCMLADVSQVSVNQSKIFFAENTSGYIEYMSHIQI